MTVRQLVDPNVANRGASQPPSVGAPALENQRQERNRSPLAVCYFQGFDLTIGEASPLLCRLRSNKSCTRGDGEVKVTASANSLHKLPGRSCQRRTPWSTCRRS
jgi:hypothetical protein